MRRKARSRRRGRRVFCYVGCAIWENEASRRTRGNSGIGAGGDGLVGEWGSGLPRVQAEQLNFMGLLFGEKGLLQKKICMLKSTGVIINSVPAERLSPRGQFRLSHQRARPPGHWPSWKQQPALLGTRARTQHSPTGRVGGQCSPPSVAGSESGLP